MVNYNPAAHTRPERRIRKFTSTSLQECSCGWIGMSLDMHIVAMEVANEVLNVIEEEE